MKNTLREYVSSEWVGVMGKHLLLRGGVLRFGQNIKWEAFVFWSKFREKEYWYVFNILRCLNKYKKHFK